MATRSTEVVPLTPDRLDDVAELFQTNGATRLCWCMAVVVPRREYYAGATGGNRLAFEAMVRRDPHEKPPMGLLAYRDGVPAGWAATGLRARYSVVTSPRSIMRKRDPAEDEDVWFVPCFFVRVGHRRDGLTAALLTAAVDLARSYGAKAIEGCPIADSYTSAETYEGREHVFAKCGFTRVARPSPRRAVMRLELGAN